MNFSNKYSGKLLHLSLRTTYIIAGICFTMVLSIITNILLGNFIDVISNSTNFKDNIGYIIVLFILTIISLILTLLFVNYLPLKLQLEKSMDISRDVMNGVLKLPQKVFEEKGSGYYINLVTSSSFTFAVVFSEINTQLIGNILCIIILLIVSFYISPAFLILFLIYIPVFYVITKAPTKKISEFQKNGLRTQDDFLSGTKQIVTDKRSINISHANDFYNESYKDKSDKYLNFAKKYKFFEIISKDIPSILSGTLRITTLAVSTYLFYRDQITLGTIILMFQLSSLLQSPLNSCFEILIYKSVNKAHLDRIKNFMEITSKESGFEKYYRRQEELVSIRNGKFYTDSNKDKLLFSIDEMHINKGSLVVIKGENGSGKSMFLNFLTGYSDPGSFEGEIHIDSSFKESSYLSYPILLVNGTLYENLFHNTPKDEVMKTLNIGFKNKVIDNNSKNLSFGEQQKLNLLRVLSRDSEVIILDEPFTNLDKESIDNLTKYILEIKGSVSIIAITHSDELDKKADYILKINNNKIMKSYKNS